MKTESLIIDTLSDILDVDPGDITPETYLIRELDAESIDLMEVAVTLNHQLNIEVTEDDIFLRRLREHLDEADRIGEERSSAMAKAYPFLSTGRIDEILADLDGGPVLKVKDLTDYVKAEPS